MTCKAKPVPRPRHDSKMAELLHYAEFSLDHYTPSHPHDCDSMVVLREHSTIILLKQFGRDIRSHIIRRAM